MDDLEQLEKLLSTADALEAETTKARRAVTTQIRALDAELSILLDELLPTQTDQANWLFKPLFRRNERPVDLFLSGRQLELREIVGRILHGGGF